jgi:hypothetical protein
MRAPDCTGRDAAEFDHDIHGLTDSQHIRRASTAARHLGNIRSAPMNNNSTIFVNLVALTRQDASVNPANLLV